MTRSVLYIYSISYLHSTLFLYSIPLMMQAVYGRPSRQKSNSTVNNLQSPKSKVHTDIQTYRQKDKSRKMRISPRLLATPSTIGSKSSLSESVALLPPLPLYRRILRVHRRKLDSEMRVLGDLYVKSEFRAHRSVENPVHIVRQTCILM